MFFREDPDVIREYPGRSPEKSYRMSPRSERLVDGIEADDLFFNESANYHLSLLDYALRNVDRFAEEDSYYQKYQKLLQKEKLIFLALFRRALRKASDPELSGMHIQLPDDIITPQVTAYDVLCQKLQPATREVCRGRLSRLLVVKMATFTKQSFESECLMTIHQIKVLNETYSTNIPLLLVSTYYNSDFVQNVAKKYSDKNLTIHVIKQPLFPLVQKLTPDPNKKGDLRQVSRSDGSDCQSESTASKPKPSYFSIAHKLTKSKHIHMLPHEVPREDWYNPGEMYTLFQQVKVHFTADDKEYILLLNSANVENVVDMKILNHLLQPHTGNRIDVCFEVIKPTDSDLSNHCEFFVQSGDKFTVLSKDSLENTGYNFTSDGYMLTNNMWINIPFLRTNESDQALLDLVFAKETVVSEEISEITLEMMTGTLIQSRGAFCIGVEVPPMRVIADGALGWMWDKLNPKWTKRIKLKNGLIYLFCAFIYHLMIYVITAGLHQRYLRSDGLTVEPDVGREQRELNVFWIENAVWLAVVIIYFLVLTSRRLKMANRSRSPQQRESRARADFFQALLLGSTRFLYAGLNKTAEVKEWFGGDAWYYLIPLHVISGLLEFIGSLLIMFLIDPPNVMEPLETS